MAINNVNTNVADTGGISSNSKYDKAAETRTIAQLIQEQEAKAQAAQEKQDAARLQKMNDKSAAKKLAESAASVQSGKSGRSGAQTDSATSDPVASSDSSNRDIGGGNNNLGGNVSANPSVTEQGDLPLESSLLTGRSNTNTTTSPTTSNYTEQAYNDYLQSSQNTLDKIDSSYADIEQYLTDANTAATEAAKLELQNQLASGKLSYEQQASYQEYLKNVARDNMILQNTAAGNLGGIGQAQYSAEMAQYDAQLLDIQLAITQLENDTASQIAQLEAQGQYELASQIAELKANKLSDYINQYNTISNMKASYANTLDSLNLTTQEQNFDQALTLVQMGASNDQIASALGVTPETAQKFADYYNTTNQLGIQLSKAQLQSALNSLASSSGDDDGGDDIDTGDMTYNQYLTMAGLLDSDSLEFFDGSTGQSLGTTGMTGNNNFSNPNIKDGDYIVINGSKFYWNVADGQFENESSAYIQQKQQAAIDTAKQIYTSVTGKELTDTTTAYNELADATSKANKAMGKAENKYYNAELQYNDMVARTKDSLVLNTYRALADNAAQEYKEARDNYNKLADARDALGQLI